MMMKALGYSIRKIIERRLLMKQFAGDNKVKDIIAGIIVALVSIPISMGYAQIAGLPVIYGLYGSLLPILVYAFITTSPQFVVGVDAMPAAMVGTLLVTLEITPESNEAKGLSILISILVAIWFVVFFAFKAGRIVKYISTPVMGGFISGVGATIILMQVPKLFGGSAGTGVLPALIINIVSQLDLFNPLAALLGFGTIAIILVCKKYIPKVPMTAIMMLVGGVLQYFLHLDQYGVKLLPEVSAGLPELVRPHFELLITNTSEILLESLSIAAVIMAQTLLATGNYASKYGDEIDNNRELLAYAGMNAAGAAVGCCPINGSVSRSGIADSYGARSQWMSISAGVTMLMVILFGTNLLRYLPVPILTGIVMTALIGIIDSKLIKRLWNESKNELFIFIAAFAGVLLFGTVYGVVIGCVLSFGEVAVRSVNPPRGLVGRIPGKGNFHSLGRNSKARPVEGAVIYRFSGNLFFANVDKFESEIQANIKPDTRCIVIDARGIGSIDITATDRIKSFNSRLKAKGVKFYITEHAGTLNDQLRRFGGVELIETGVVRRTITLALRDAGFEKPYTLEGGRLETDVEYLEADERLSELEWAFGVDAEKKLLELANQTAEEIVEAVSKHEEYISVLSDHGATTSWGMLGLFDEQYLWDHIEARLEDLHAKGILSDEDRILIEERIEKRRESGERRLREINPRAMRILHEKREHILEHMKQNDPNAYEKLMKLHNEYKKR